MPRSNFDNLRLADQVEESHGSTWRRGLPQRAGGVPDVGWGFMDNDPAQVLEQETFRADTGTTASSTASISTTTSAASLAVSLASSPCAVFRPQLWPCPLRKGGGGSGCHALPEIQSGRHGRFGSCGTAKGRHERGHPVAVLFQLPVFPKVQKASKRDCLSG